MGPNLDFPRSSLRYETLMTSRGSCFAGLILTAACASSVPSEPVDSGLSVDAAVVAPGDAGTGDSAAPIDAPICNSWCDVSTGFAGSFLRVRVAANDLWLVGSKTSGASGSGSIFRWANGAPVAVGQPVGNSLYDVSVTSETDIRSVGGSQQIAAYHWDGQTWTADSPSGTLRLAAIWAFGPADVWAGGGDVQDGTGRLFRKTTAWADQSTAPTVLPGYAADFWGASGNLWAVGRVAGHTSSGYIARWDGAQWATLIDKATDRLNAIWGSSQSDIWVVGDGGLVYHFDGKQWSLSPRPDRANLSAIWGTSANDVWAAGSDAGFASGVVIHWNGSTWKDESPTTNSQLRGVGAIGKTLVVAGSGGTILKKTVE